MDSDALKKRLQAEEEEFAHFKKLAEHKKNGGSSTPPPCHKSAKVFDEDAALLQKLQPVVSFATLPLSCLFSFLLYAVLSSYYLYSLLS